MDDQESDAAPTRELTGPQTLGDRHSVALAETLTWIAFNNALLPNELKQQVQGHRLTSTKDPDERFQKLFFDADGGDAAPTGAGHFHDRDAGLQRLREAWSHLREEVARGNIKVRGRHTSNYSQVEASIADIVELTGDIVASFSQFDVSIGGIRRQPDGSPGVLWDGHANSFDREFDAAVGGDARMAEGFLVLEVERAGLAASGALSPSNSMFKGSSIPTDAEVLKKADAMKAMGMTGHALSSRIRCEPGFEQVSVTYVRDLAKGRGKGGRPNTKPA